MKHVFYVSPLVAKLLKKAGFDWECETCYIGKGKLPHKYHEPFNWNMPRNDFEKEGSNNLFYAFINQSESDNFRSAPTIDVALRWLLREKNIVVETIAGRYASSNKYDFSVHYYFIDKDDWIREDGDHLKCFDNRDEAYEAGIVEVLKQITL